MTLSDLKFTIIDRDSFMQRPQISIKEFILTIGFNCSDVRLNHLHMNKFGSRMFDHVILGDPYLVRLSEIIKSQNRIEHTPQKFTESTELTGVSWFRICVLVFHLCLYQCPRHK